MKRLLFATLLLGSAMLAGETAAQGTSTIAVSRAAARPWRVAPAENFTGTARVQQLFDTTASTRAYAARVSFDAGARTAWHTHPRGQVLMVTEGVGRAQLWGGPVEEIRVGDVVHIPPGAKHWHGASPTSAMTHIAIVEYLGGRSTHWMEKVSDAQYGASVRARPAAASARAATADSARPSRAQQLMGDIAPKLVQLTDSVLFGDVWARPGLSPRDRSLVTVSALVAMNRPDQLRSHLALARENGVTRDELVEAITHLAFYAGWPSAVTAVGVAKEVLPQEGSPAAGASGGAEQEVLRLSREKWRWMSERNTDSLAVLFHQDAMFVHMGGSMTRSQELDVIRTGAIQYRRAEIQDASVRLIGPTTAIVLNRIRLVAVVGGNEVVNPFMVTEVYVRQNSAWTLGSLSFTRLLTAP